MCFCMIHAPPHPPISLLAIVFRMIETSARGCFERTGGREEPEAGLLSFRLCLKMVLPSWSRASSPTPPVPSNEVDRLSPQSRLPFPRIIQLQLLALLLLFAPQPARYSTDDMSQVVRLLSPCCTSSDLTIRTRPLPSGYFAAAIAYSDARPARSCCSLRFRWVIQYTMGDVEKHTAADSAWVVVE